MVNEPPSHDGTRRAAAIWSVDLALVRMRLIARRSESVLSPRNEGKNASEWNHDWASIRNVVVVINIQSSINPIFPSSDHENEHQQRR